MATKINFKCNCFEILGVNTDLKDRIKQIVSTMPEIERVSILMWDEVSLQSQLEYIPKKDKVVGFTEWGNKRTDDIADNALLFIVKGLQSSWKMPVAYGFCNAATPWYVLIEIIEDVVIMLTETGLIIEASVCDQGAANESAVKTMISKTDSKRTSKNLEKCKNNYIL